MKSLPSRGLQVQLDNNEWNGAWVIAVTGVLLILVTFYVLQSVAGIPVFALIFNPSEVAKKYHDKRGAAITILACTLAIILIAMIVYVRRRWQERDEGDGSVTRLKTTRRRR